MSCTDKLTVSQQGERQISVSQLTDGKDETWSPAEMSVARRQPWSMVADCSTPARYHITTLWDGQPEFLSAQFLKLRLDIIGAECDDRVLGTQVYTSAAAWNQTTTSCSFWK